VVVPLPRQNRVDPFGQLIATPARGLLMGNRGCLHDADGRPIGRRWTTKTWISCRLDFRGRWRPVTPPRRYTALFFLDEATALAAGHRPCGECRHADYRRFKAAWCTGNKSSGLTVATSIREIDDILHGERLSAGARTFPAARLDDLPDGTLWLFRENDLHEPWIVTGDRIARWTPAGYDRLRERPAGLTVRVLTPPSMVEAMRGGFTPTIHPTLR
jgi:hypothetical protein